MSLKDSEVTKGGDGDGGDLSDLYMKIKRQPNVTGCGYLLRVNSSGKDVPRLPSPEKDVKNKPVFNGRRIHPSVRKPEEAQFIEENVEGSIKIHSLSSNDQIMVPETHRNQPILENGPKQLIDNFVCPKSSRTALVSRTLESREKVASLRHCRPASAAVSTTSFNSDWTSMTGDSRPGSVHTQYSVHPQELASMSTGLRSEGLPSRASSRQMNMPSIAINSVPCDLADYEEERIRSIFQLPAIKEPAYNEWRVGSEDPTEESRNLRELSEALYFREIRPYNAVTRKATKNEKEHYNYHICNGVIPEFISKFAVLPAPPNYMVKCIITRNRNGIEGKLYPTYYLHLECPGREHVLLLTAKRTSRIMTSYVISTNPADMSSKSPSCIGILRSNLRGSMFRLRTRVPEYSDNELELKRIDFRNRECKETEMDQILTLQFDPNIMGMKGPRRITTIIPKLKSDWQKCYPGSFENKGNSYLATVNNRQPIWNPEAGNYTLHFNNRVKESSVKNFQLISPDFPEVTLLQFGRLKEDTFILDFQYPFCLLQAFGIALCNFDPMPGLD